MSKFNKLIKLAKIFEKKYFKLNFNKFSSNFSLITKEISKYSPEMDKYKNQIKDLLIQRYQKELKYTPQTFESGDSIEEMIPEKIFITINPETDEVLSVSGANENYGANRLKMFAGKEVSLANMRLMQSAMFQQLEQTFKNPNTFAELSYDLFEKFEKLYKHYIKSKGQAPFTLYYLPAESVAKLIPHRKMLVLDDGVGYRKFVHGAGSWAHKITVSNSKNINGAEGYETFEEASNIAKYKNKFIQGTPYGIKEIKFNINY